MNLSATLKATLDSLRLVGTVRGVCLCRDGEILENLFPFSPKRMQALCDEGTDIFSDFVDRERDIERLVMGFDGGQLVMLADGELLLLLMHMIPDEADFVAKAGRAFLNDYRLENGTAENVVPFPEEPHADEVEEPEEIVPPVAEHSGPMTFRELLIAAENAPEQHSAEISLLAQAEQASKQVANDIQPAKPQPAASAARAQRSRPIRKRIVGEVVVQPARLAAQQPQSTLPPPKKPRVRSRRQSS